MSITSINWSNILLEDVPPVIQSNVMIEYTQKLSIGIVLYTYKTIISNIINIEIHKRK